MIQMTRVALTLCLLAFMTMPMVAQKMLQFEKTGRLRTEKFRIGDEITFKLRDDETGWYTRPINDLMANGQMMMLGTTWYPTDALSHLKLRRQRTWVNIVGGALQGGGASMILGDLWYTIRGNPEFTQGGWEFGLINIAVGTGLRAALAPIKYRLGEKKRLRVVDLTY